MAVSPRRCHEAPFRPGVSQSTVLPITNQSQTSTALPTVLVLLISGQGEMFLCGPVSSRGEKMKEPEGPLLGPPFSAHRHVTCLAQMGLSGVSTP